MSTTNNIILFDGECNLCNGFVQFVIKNDKKKIFKFSSLQSNYGQNYLHSKHLSQSQFSSFIYIKNNGFLQKSTAALHIFKDLGGLWQVLFVFIVFPTAFRDFFYEVIAKNRYKWFGKRNTCWVPTKDLESRFL
jgi:predicted DCC family thiol-disulfide oxidoreductase YuxK